MNLRKAVEAGRSTQGGLQVQKVACQWIFSSSDHSAHLSPFSLPLRLDFLLREGKWVVEKEPYTFDGTHPSLSMVTVPFPLPAFKMTMSSLFLRDLMALS